MLLVVLSCDETLLALEIPILRLVLRAVLIASTFLGPTLGNISAFDLAWEADLFCQRAWMVGSLTAISRAGN